MPEISPWAAAKTRQAWRRTKAAPPSGAAAGAVGGLAGVPIAGRVGETPVAWSPADSVWPKPGLVFRGGRGSVPGSLVESTGYGRNWSFAERTISAPITPMKSERWEPNWSFANPQGSWFNGAGSRNGSGGNGVCVARRSIRQAMA